MKDILGTTKVWIAGPIHNDHTRHKAGKELLGDPCPPFTNSGDV